MRLTGEPRCAVCVRATQVLVRRAFRGSNRHLFGPIRNPFGGSERAEGRPFTDWRFLFVEVGAARTYAMRPSSDIAVQTALARVLAMHSHSKRRQTIW